MAKKTDEMKQMLAMPWNTQRPSDERMLSIIADAIQDYSGDAAVLESAIGALVLGRALGWRALRLLHSNVTYHRYESILGIKFVDELPERTAQSRILRGVRIADALGDFWGYVTGGQVDRRQGRFIDSEPIELPNVT